MANESVFLSYVRHAFTKWTGFQAAIDEGMGGPYAREKEFWMATEIENYFKHYDDVKPEDIEEYLGAMLENEFDTYFEDDSLFVISKHFCHAYKLSQTDPKDEIFYQSNHLPNMKLSQQCHQELKPQVLSEIPDSSVEAKMQQLTVNGTELPTNSDMDFAMPVNPAAQNTTESSCTDNDGWTVVTKKDRKNK